MAISAGVSGQMPSRSVSLRRAVRVDSTPAASVQYALRLRQVTHDPEVVRVDHVARGVLPGAVAQCRREAPVARRTELCTMVILF